MTFKPGDKGTISDFRWRVLAGKKKSNDLVLELLNHEGKWVRVKMELAFLLCDFHYQTEDILYPERWQKGGMKFVHAVKTACFAGWEKAAHSVVRERERKGNGSPLLTTVPDDDNLLHWFEI